MSPERPRTELEAAGMGKLKALQFMLLADQPGEGLREESRRACFQLLKEAREALGDLTP